MSAVQERHSASISPIAMGVGFDNLTNVERGEPVLICQTEEQALLVNEQMGGAGYAVGLDGAWTVAHGEYLSALAPTFVFCDREFCQYVAKTISGCVGQFYRLQESDLGQFVRDGHSFVSLYGAAYEAEYFDPDLSIENDFGAVNDAGLIPLEGRPLPQADYPVDVLGPVMAPIVRSIITNVQVSTPLAAQSVLAVAALTAQQFVNVKPPYFSAKPRPCSLFFLTRAESGERKSAANEAAMKPIRRWENHLAEQYEFMRDDYVRAERGYKKLVAKAEAKAKDMNEIRQMIEAIGEEPQPPLSSTIILSEPTTEGYLKSAETSHAGRAIITDEAGAFLGGHSMSSEKKQHTITTLSKAWDGSAVVLARVGRETPPVRHKRLTMHLMGQSVVINPLLSDPLAQGQGFLARFLTVSAAPRAGFRELQTRVTPEDYRALEAWDKHIYGIWSKRMAPMQQGSRNELKPHELELDAGAFDVWREYESKTEKAQRPDGVYAEMKPFASKAAEQALRLAGVFTVIEKPETSRMIDADTMARAVVLMQFYANEHLRLIQEASVDPQLSAAAKLIDWIKASRGTYVYKNDLRQNGPNALRKGIDDHLKTLAEYNHIKGVDARVIDGKLRQNCYEVMT